MNPGRLKVEREGKCRMCGAPAHQCDAAHLIDRSLAGGGDFTNPDLLIPLCSRIKGGVGCHEEYDEHKLNIMLVLTIDEIKAAVELVGFHRAGKRMRGIG